MRDIKKSDIMKAIKISASPKQLSRLRNGHAVRIKEDIEGTGMNLLVDPSKFDAATRCFTKGTAYQIQLSPDEIMANKKAVQDGTIGGEGIFAGGKLKVPKALKKLGSAVERIGEKGLSGLSQAERAVRQDPYGRAIVNTAAPMIAQAGLSGLAAYGGADPFTASLVGKSGAAATKVGLKQAGYGLYAGQSRGGKINLGKAFKKVGSAFEKAGNTGLSALSQAEEAVRNDPYGRAIVKTAVPILAQGGLTAALMAGGADPFTASLVGSSGAAASKEGLKQAGYGLYAGRGMCGGALAGPPSRMPEVSSVAIGGSLLAKSNLQLPPALQSDAMSANFHMNTQLPPHFQRGGVRFV